MEHATTESIAPPASIAVFARAPAPGQAKTRLIPRLGPDGAARLQTVMIQRAVRTAVSAGVGPVSLWCAPDCDHPAFDLCRDQFGVELVAQQGNDLGARMLDAFARLCGSGSTIVVGTDCPALTADELRNAATALADGEDAVFVPAEDGGYVLVGLRHPVPTLFTQMRWSGDRVMADTRDRLRQARLRWRELPTSWDVDRPIDFDRLLRSGLMANEAGWTG